MAKKKKTPNENKIAGGAALGFYGAASEIGFSSKRGRKKSLRLVRKASKRRYSASINKSQAQGMSKSRAKKRFFKSQRAGIKLGAGIRRGAIIGGAALLAKGLYERRKKKRKK